MWKCPWLVLFYAAWSILLCLLPVTRVLGYELAWGVVLFTALGGAWLLARESPLRRAVALALPLAFGLANGFIVKNCDPLGGVGWYLLLALPHGLFLSTWAAFLRRERNGIVWYYASITGALVANLIALYAGPSVRVYSIAWGFFAGSIYDEALPIPTPLYWHQAMVVALWLSLVLGGSLRRVTLAVALGIFACGNRLSFRVDRADLHTALSRTTSTGHLLLHYKAHGVVERTLEDLWPEAERIAQGIASDLDVEPAKPTHVYLYDSLDDKERFTGARQTLFTRPWVPEVHMLGNDLSSLGHELVHAFAAEWHPSGFSVPLRYHVLPAMGVVEGLAVAVADSEADNTRQSMAALREAGRFVDLRTLFSSAGFYTDTGARAYTAVGDFMRYVLETRGVEPLRKAYEDGDLEGALGVPLDTVISAYEAALDAVSIDAVVAKTIADQLKERPLYRRVCGREQAERRARINAALDARSFEEARALSAAMRKDDAQDVGAILSELEVARRLALESAHGWPAYDALLDQLLQRQDLPLSAQLRLYEARAERRGDREDLAQALALAAKEDDRRRIELKLEVIERPDAELLLTAIASDTPNPRAIALLLEAFHAAPSDPVIAYFLARRWAINDDVGRALSHLQTAIQDADNLPASAQFEALRLRVEWLVRARDFTALPAAVAALEGAADSTAERAKALHWKRRAFFYLHHQTW